LKGFKARTDENNKRGTTELSFLGPKLSGLERQFSENADKTKAVFAEETTTIESGLALMFKLTAELNETLRKKNDPNLLANRNLFARNRQLLLEAYSSTLRSNYGTAFVILRTVLENNNLMRLFNLHPEYVSEWLSGEEFENWWVRDELFKEINKEDVGKNIREIYGELCDYTHPNFKGWQELLGSAGTEEVLLETPAFVGDNASKTIGLAFLLMELSFKTVVETFKSSLFSFTYDFTKWQLTWKKLIDKFNG
jgi:hypothetical protein